MYILIRKRGKGTFGINTRGEADVKVEAETGGIQSQTRNIGKYQKLEETWTDSILWSPEGSRDLLIL
jgi:hypothetical protein